MLNVSFTCNSLRLGDMLKAVLKMAHKSDMADLFVAETARYFQVQQEKVFLFGAGRMALYSFLKSLDLKRDDEIIVTGYTCVVVTNAIKYLDVKIRYVDIKEQTLNIDTEKLISSINKNTKAIIISHNFGVVYEDISLIKKLYPSIIIVEDSAHALGSVDINNRKTGIIGDAAFFSMEYSKPITTGLGGILIINNETLLEKFNKNYIQLTNYPPTYNIKIFLTLLFHLLTSYRYSSIFKSYFMTFIRKINLLAVTSQSEIEGNMPEFYPVRLSHTLAYIGYLQMKRIEEINTMKAVIAKTYHKQFLDILKVKDFYSPNYIYVRYPVLFDESVPLDTINRIKQRIRKESGLSVGEWFNDVVHPKGSFRYCYTEGTCKVGESIAKRIINLPVSIHLDTGRDDISKLGTIFREELTT